MKQEFRDKSASRRRRIFLRRTGRLVDGLLDTLESKTSVKKTALERAAIRAELVAEIYDGVVSNLDDILSEKVTAPISQDDLIDRLVKRLE